MNNGVDTKTGIALLFGALLLTAGCGELDEAPEPPELFTEKQPGLVREGLCHRRGRSADLARRRPRGPNP